MGWGGGGIFFVIPARRWPACCRCRRLSLRRCAWEAVQRVYRGPKAELHRYVQSACEALLWKLDGLAEYDMVRPMVSTGTNLVGWSSMSPGTEAGYFGVIFGRPSEDAPAVDRGRRRTQRGHLSHPSQA